MVISMIKIKRLDNENIERISFLRITRRVRADLPGLSGPTFYPSGPSLSSLNFATLYSIRVKNSILFLNHPFLSFTFSTVVTGHLSPLSFLFEESHD